MSALSAEDYAATFSADLAAADRSAPRSLLSASGQVGISDLGGCSEKVRRMIAKTPATDSPSGRAAMIGNALDRMFKTARQKANPHLLFDVPVQLTLPNGAVVPGTVDEVDPDEPSATDYKSKDGLADVRKAGPDLQNRFQVHNYYAALIQAGTVPEGGVVRLIYFDRSGSDPNDVVFQEPFSWAVVKQSSDWLEAVIEAHKAGDEASKDRPRPFCRRFCEFFSTCRGPELAAGTISIPRIAQMVNLYAEADEMQKQGTAIKAALRDDLAGVTGRTDKAELVSTSVNGKGGPSWRLEVTRTG